MKLIMPIVAGAMLTVAVENATQGQPADSSRLDDAATGAVAGGDRGAKTDSEAGIGSASLADAGSGPLAFGVVFNDGTKQSGTANWTSSYNATYKRYEIAISGQNYYYLNFITWRLRLGTCGSAAQTAWAASCSSTAMTKAVRCSRPVSHLRRSRVHKPQSRLIAAGGSQGFDQARSPCVSVEIGFVCHRYSGIVACMKTISSSNRLSCMMIVSGARPWIKPSHDRMPVLLEAKDFCPKATYHLTCRARYMRIQLKLLRGRFSPLTFDEMVSCLRGFGLSDRPSPDRSLRWLRSAHAGA